MRLKLCIILIITPRLETSHSCEDQVGRLRDTWHWFPFLQPSTANPLFLWTCFFMMLWLPQSCWRLRKSLWGCCQVWVVLLLWVSLFPSWLPLITVLLIAWGSFSHVFPPPVGLEPLRVGIRSAHITIRTIPRMSLALREISQWLNEMGPSFHFSI